MLWMTVRWVGWLLLVCAGLVGGTLGRALSSGMHTSLVYEVTTLNDVLTVWEMPSNSRWQPFPETQILGVFEYSAVTNHVAMVPEPYTQVVIHDLHTGAEQGRFDLERQSIFALHWAPDGRMLMLFPFGGAMILVDTLTGARHPVGEAAQSVGYDLWSGDGRWLLYFWYAADNTDPQYYVFDRETGMSTPVTTPTETYLMADISPDGQSVIAHVEQGNGSWDVFALDVQHAQQRRLTSDPRDEIVAGWLSDGRMVAYSCGPQAHYVYLIDPATDAVQQWALPFAGAVCQQTAWQRPNERAIRVVDDALLLWVVQSVTTLYAVDLASGTAQRVVTLPEPVFLFSSEVYAMTQDNQWLLVRTSIGDFLIDVQRRTRVKILP
jgi:hypothetical protein